MSSNKNSDEGKHPVIRLTQHMPEDSIWNGMDLSEVLSPPSLDIEERIAQMIDSRLKAAVDAKFDSVSQKYRDKKHFYESVWRIYGLIATKTCERWDDIFGENCEITPADIAAPNGLSEWLCQLKPVPISYEDFSRSLSRFQRHGKKIDAPYKPALDALVAAGIVHRNNHYSAKRFPKSYMLNNAFVYEVASFVFLLTKPNIPIDGYDCFQAHYPAKLLHKKLHEAKRLYDSLGERGGLTVKLPDGWESMTTPFGRFTFSEKWKLNIDNLIDGMKKFKKQNATVKRHGREYNWFVACSSAFRPYLFKGERHYRELVDCHSGFFWMYAIYGWKKGKIELSECKKMIEECFAGTFYQNNSEREKTREVKTAFMKVLNMSPAQIAWLEDMDFDDGMITTIVRNLERNYPQWTSFLESERMKFKSQLGKRNHIHITKIEKHIMNKLAEYLNKLGYNDLIRVHDALYGLDSIDNDRITGLLKSIVYEYL